MVLLADACADTRPKDNCGLLQVGSYFIFLFFFYTFGLVSMTYLSKQLLTSAYMVILLQQSGVEQEKTTRAVRKSCVLADGFAR